VIVEEKADADHPGRAQRFLMRQHEAQRPDDMRRTFQQHLALAQRLAHQAELVIFQIAQATMDQLGAGGRGGAGEIVLLDHQDLEPAAGGVARNADAVDAAANDQEIEAVRFELHRRRRGGISGNSSLNTRNPPRWPFWG
jgi:hypothetical protein